jgi:hypothetical protein
MGHPHAIKELIAPAVEFDRLTERLPDSARARFIQVAANAALLAIRVDKPLQDLRGLHETQLEMMKQCLEEWAKEDGF